MSGNSEVGPRVQEDFQRQVARSQRRVARSPPSRSSGCGNAQNVRRDVKVQLEISRRDSGIEAGRTGQADSEVVHWLLDEEKEEVVQAWRKEVKTVCDSSGALAAQPPPLPGLSGLHHSGSRRKRQRLR